MYVSAATWDYWRNEEYVFVCCDEISSSLLSNAPFFVLTIESICLSSKQRNYFLLFTICITLLLKRKRKSAKQHSRCLSLSNSFSIFTTPQVSTSTAKKCKLKNFLKILFWRTFLFARKNIFLKEKEENW